MLHINMSESTIDDIMDVDDDIAAFPKKISAEVSNEQAGALSGNKRGYEDDDCNDDNDDGPRAAKRLKQVLSDDIIQQSEEYQKGKDDEGNAEAATAENSTNHHFNDLA